MDETTVIIGAGICGLLLARALTARGERVTVLEKSRGLGGRMATKRVGEAVFDQGAQYFTARDPAFQAEVAAWARAGLVAPWPGSAHRVIGKKGMTTVPKALGEGLDIRREWKATAARRVGAGWEIEGENQPKLIASRLLLTAPVPQALALLKAGEMNLPADLTAALGGLTYHPCLALLVVLDGPSAVPAEGVKIDGGPLRWVADNTKKGLAPGVPAALTLHGGPTFAAEHYGKSEAEVAALLRPAAEAWFGGAKAVSATLHRWKFSEPVTTYPEPCVWRPEWALGLAGDAFGGPKVEGAARSGWALAARIAGA